MIVLLEKDGVRKRRQWAWAQTKEIEGARCQWCPSRHWPEGKHLGLKMKVTHLFPVVHISCWVRGPHSGNFHDINHANHTTISISSYLNFTPSWTPLIVSWLTIELSLSGVWMPWSCQRNALCLVAFEPMSPLFSVHQPKEISEPLEDQHLGWDEFT